MNFPVPASDSEEEEMPIGRGYNIGAKMKNMENVRNECFFNVLLVCG
jgi:hypothetical protein